MQTHELAWAAGFFDGEGHIRCDRGTVKGKLYPRITLHAPQRDTRVLERMVKALGRGKVLGPYNNNGGPIYHFHVCNFEDVQMSVASMWPWLSPVKREQAAAALGKFVGFIREKRASRLVEKE